MKNASLFLLLISTNCIFSQTVSFDRDHPIKSNDITGYRLCNALIDDKDSNQLFHLHNHDYIGKQIKYVVYSTFTNEVIDCFGELWEYDFFYSYTTIAAHDLSFHYILLEHEATKAVTRPNFTYNGKDWIENDTMLQYENRFVAWDNTKHEKHGLLQVQLERIMPDFGEIREDPFYNDIDKFYRDLGNEYSGHNDYFNALYCFRKEYEICNCDDFKSFNGKVQVNALKSFRSWDCSNQLVNLIAAKYYLKDYYGCIEYGNQYVHSLQTPMSDAYEEMMNSYFQLKKFDKAIACADSMIKMDEIPGFTRKMAFVHAVKGIALINSSQKDKGCEELGIAVELGNKDALRLIHNCCNQPCSNEIGLAENDIEIYNEIVSDKKSITIPLTRRKDDLFEVTGEINDIAKLKFILDCGASEVSVPPNIVQSLIYSGSLKQSDFYGEQEYRLADGSTIKSSTFIIHKLKIGDLFFEEIKASIGSSNDAPLLLGQNLLKKFGTVTLDYYNNKLLITK